MTTNLDSLIVTPVVKWVGGKRQLQDTLLPILSAGMGDFQGSYIEPFIGGGAMFFALKHGNSIISDINSGLINLYESLRSHPEELVATLRNIEQKYNSTPLEQKRGLYYEFREKYNSESRSGLTQAANFLFLNKTSFNGMYRENKSGHFNVPFGNKVNINLGDTENLLTAASILGNAKIFNHSYIETTKDAKRGDLVYFDPPYVPLTATATFTSYSAEGFGFEKQEELANEFARLDGIGVKVVQSNSSSPLVEELYRNYKLVPVSASRNISAKSTGRKPVTELIITNF